MRAAQPLASTLILFGLLGTASAGEVTYSGTGTYFASKVLMPLGNGGAAVKMDNTVIATIAPADYGFLFGECTGLGYLTPEGEFSSAAYCNLREDEEHSLDIHAERNGDSGTVTILGGTGKWKDASGSIEMTEKFTGENRGSFVYTMTVKTP